MPLVTRLSGEGVILADSNRIETVEEDEELETIPRSPPNRENGGVVDGGGESDGGDRVDDDEDGGGGGGLRQSRAMRLLQDRRRLVDRTVSEGQLKIVPVGLRVRSKSTDDDSERPDFFELRAKDVMKNYWLRQTFTSWWALRSTPFAADLLPCKGASGLTAKFLKEMHEILVEYVQESYDRTTKILEFNHPHDLREKLHLELPDKAENLDQILNDCRNTLKYCVHTGHPRFFNQISQGLDIVSMAGEWLTATANTNMFTYEIAPVFVLMERATLKKMREIVGFKDGDGIFAPGGAVCNLYAVLAARHKFFPACKRRGLFGLPNLVMFTSEQSHFSIKRAASILGIGTDNLILVETDDRGRMSAEDFENKVQQAIGRGDKPFFVNATAGTTVVGAYDPINKIADICSKYNLWMHVDAAWGGGALLSRKHRHKLDGVSRADSVTWNPHKMMGITLQCAAVLFREDGLLEDCNSMRAPYLFQQDKHYDVSFDTGDKTIQCGRHVDVFKLWLTWRSKGTRGYEVQINKLFELAQYLVDKIKAREGFELVYDKPELTNVCFWYYPPSLREMENCQEKQLKLHKVAPEIKAMMMNKGTVMVGYQPLGSKVNFFRMIVNNTASTKSDIDFMLDEIERLGKPLTWDA
ncbi:glutamate decarboxylase 1-like isoform X1 [Lytechinus variegatus]|uniref:glutamate decarboxylase 1-like isoform X1 n=1 Tax=Lytechinus variegatus TaxID=7654 RepID=UPI001BB2BE03|nr:glutamate decarboxylase 1-like isoform X1 [Lytechinus variegatus]